MATGRKVDLAAIGAGVLGVDETLRALPVDERLLVADGVWAVGDIVGKGAFTHVSMYHAAIVERRDPRRGGPDADYRALPRVTFTDPEIGSVGTERAAGARPGPEHPGRDVTDLGVVDPRLDPPRPRA